MSADPSGFAETVGLRRLADDAQREAERCRLKATELRKQADERDAYAAIWEGRAARYRALIDGGESGE